MERRDPSKAADLETLTALPQSMYEDASASAELGVIRLTCPESGQGCVDVWPTPLLTRGLVWILVHLYGRQIQKTTNKII